MEIGALGIPLNYLIHSVSSSTNSIQNHLLQLKTFSMRIKPFCTYYEKAISYHDALFWTSSKPLRIKYLQDYCNHSELTEHFAIKNSSVAGNIQMARVKLVDFGVPRIATISDIGHLDENFTEFPIQSISLCLLNLIPWNSRTWNDEDTRYVTELLNENRYEICIQFEMQPDSIFTSDLCSSGFDYVDVIISKGIACRNASNDFHHHVEEICKNN